ncbi:hypothetical protein EB001_10740 [bacterium]|nr:hypothetical protein [bacterium]
MIKISHWAELDENNIVTRVLVGSNEDSDEGYQWLIDNLGGTWVKTSYNTQGGVHSLGGTPLRKNYAGIGYSYDADRDAFIPPKPFNSWLLNEDTCLWDAPTPYPTDGKFYRWVEEDLNWQEIVVGE